MRLDHYAVLQKVGVTTDLFFSLPIGHSYSQWPLYNPPTHIPQSRSEKIVNALCQFEGSKTLSFCSYAGPVLSNVSTMESIFPAPVCEEMGSQWRLVNHYLHWAY